MRKFFHRYLPHPETVKNLRWIKPFGSRMHHPNLWHFHRRSVAGGVAIGLFCGLIPGPLQMVSAALLAILFRVNLPVAAFTTLYTNPFTILPLYVVAYKMGAWVSGTSGSIKQLSFPELHWQSLPTELWTWFLMLGKPFLIGLPLLAVILAILGYILVRVVWRIAVIWKWRNRRHKAGSRSED